MMEDFSDLALPPLFGGHILEAELETEGVEFVDGGGVSESQVEEESQERERRESERERDRRKYCNLSRRCREIEQVREREMNSGIAGERSPERERDELDTPELVS
ncbi:UNVERIFIED_CONTAM: hypothetical protein FKN15_005426 [Acipenser sinensis]